MKLSATTIPQIPFKDRIIGNIVVKGGSGFLFYINPKDGDNLKDVLKQNLLSGEQIKFATNKLQNISKTCSSLNIPFLLVVGPNKHSVYRELFPLNEVPGPSRMDQFETIIKSLNISYIFPRDHLRAKLKETSFPIYYETDTHWNSMAAYYAFQLLKPKIQEIFPNIQFPDIQYNFTATVLRGYGDLMKIGRIRDPKNYTCHVVTATPLNETLAYYQMVNNRGMHFDTVVPNSTLPKALIFRDSFFTVLQPFVSPLFSHAHFLWQPINLSCIPEYKPDIVIYELVERHTFYSFCR